MAKRQNRSHRDLGPILFPIHAIKSGGGPEISPLGAQDGFHHFGDKTSNRNHLHPDIMIKIADQIRLNPSRTTGVTSNLNSPDGLSDGIPAGYTYLFQLASHDIINSLLPARMDGTLKPPPQNLRIKPLELETVMGRGSASCPFAYDSARKLRLGHVKKTTKTDWEWSYPPRDLPRVSFSQDGAKRPTEGLDTVLVPDARNDDNMILAQLTALFHGVYNYILNRSSMDEDNPTLSEEETAREVFVRLYRRILRKDLLRKVLHPDVYRAYLNTDIQLDTSGRDGSVSLEFAFAAGRLGHAMVRDGYRSSTRQSLTLKTAIKTSSSHIPKRLPITKHYLIDWDLFFEPASGADEDNFNWAFKFGPRFAATMASALAAPAPIGPNEQPVGRHGTIYRDFIREESYSLLSVAQLVTHLITQAKKAGIQDLFDHVATVEAQHSLVTQGLRDLEAGIKLSDYPKLTEHEETAIAADPPLSLFLMFEARAYGNDGATLGPVGSVLIAEAMRATFRPATWEGEDGQSSEAEITVFGENISTMPDLIAHLRASAPNLFAT